MTEEEVISDLPSGTKFFGPATKGSETVAMEHSFNNFGSYLEPGHSLYFYNDYCLFSYNS